MLWWTNAKIKYISLLHKVWFKVECYYHGFTVQQKTVKNWIQWELEISEVPTVCQQDVLVAFNSPKWTNRQRETSLYCLDLNHRPFNFQSSATLSQGWICSHLFIYLLLWLYVDHWQIILICRIIVSLLLYHYTCSKILEYINLFESICSNKTVFWSFLNLNQIHKHLKITQYY